MFILYLSCLIFGGILLGASFIMGDSHGSHELDAHAGGHDLSGGDPDLSHDVDHSGDIDHQGDAADAAKFLSFRNIIFFMAFFGLTGTVLELMSANFLITLAASVGIGAMSWVTGHKFYKYLLTSQSGESLQLGTLKGRTGKVLLGLSGKEKGKISVCAGGNTIELKAKISDASKKNQFKFGDRVLIIEVKDNMAYIVETDYLN